jgi:hypothetical protein
MFERACLPDNLLELELSLQGILDFRKIAIEWPSRGEPTRATPATCPIG